MGNDVQEEGSVQIQVEFFDSEVESLALLAGQFGISMPNLIATQTRLYLKHETHVISEYFDKIDAIFEFEKLRR